MYFKYILEKGVEIPMFALFHQICAQLKLILETVFFLINSDKIYFASLNLTTERDSLVKAI